MEFNFFKKKKVNNTNNNIAYRNDAGSAITSHYTGFSSGVNVTIDTMLQIPTAGACLDMITNAISQLPIYLYEENQNGEITKLTGDYRERLLNDEPSEFETGDNLKRQIVKDYLIHGNSYNYIERIGNEVKSITNLNPENIEVVKFIKQGYKLVKADIIYKLEDNDEDSGKSSKKKEIKFKSLDVLTVVQNSTDGLNGKGVLYFGAEVLKSALEEKEYTQHLYKNSALPLGILSTDGRLSDDNYNNVKNSWQQIYTGVENAGKTVILEEGLKYSPISLKPSDLLLTDNRKDNVSDICKLFNLPESLIDVSKAKYGSLEQNNAHFLQYTLSPIISVIESSLNKSLLLEDEKTKGCFFAFDTSEVLRTTEKELVDSTISSVNGGLLSLNEGRRKLNMKPVNDDIIKLNLGNVFYYPTTGEMIVPNLGTKVDKEGNKENEQKLE